MFLTPRFLRKIVGKLDDRKAHDLIVRARTAAVFYFVIGFALGFLIAYFATSQG